MEPSSPCGPVSPSSLGSGVCDPPCGPTATATGPGGPTTSLGSEITLVNPVSSIKIMKPRIRNSDVKNVVLTTRSGKGFVGIFLP